MYHDLRPECATGLTSDQKSDLNDFIGHYKTNSSIYDRVGKSSNVPAILVAAIHWREASGDFTTYLSQGDPLGTRTWANGDSNDGKSLSASIPNTILFTNWDDAAIFALNYETSAKSVSGISYDEQDINDMLTFAEYYNGLGYKKRGVPSPYILSGTSCYKSGKFDSDGHYNSQDVDDQIGVLVMLRALVYLDSPVTVAPITTPEPVPPNNVWSFFGSLFSK